MSTTKPPAIRNAWREFEISRWLTLREQMEWLGFQALSQVEYEHMFSCDIDAKANGMGWDVKAGGGGGDLGRPSHSAGFFVAFSWGKLRASGSAKAAKAAIAIVGWESTWC